MSAPPGPFHRALPIALGVTMAGLILLLAHVGLDRATLDLTDEDRARGSWTALVETHQALLDADKAWKQKLDETTDDAQAAAEAKLQVAWARASEAFARSERQLRSAY